jgi:hypothetical protein
MSVKPLLLATFAALAVVAAPIEAPAQTLQPGWISPAQDRGQPRQALRPLREVLDSLRSRYGGEYVSHWVEDGQRPIYVIRWRMPDGVTIREFRVDAAR